MKVTTFDMILGYVIIDAQMASVLGKELRGFCGTRRLFTVFLRALTIQIQPTNSDCSSLRFILILSSFVHVAFRVDFSLQVCQLQFYMHLSSALCTFHVHLSHRPFILTNVTMFHEDFELRIVDFPINPLGHVCTTHFKNNFTFLS